ncbi:response regulator [bacterium]|nr:MAG: response regulator [bacterium]
MHVLLIEDNPADAALVRAFLSVSQPPVQTEHVARLADALALLARGAYDAVLLDLSLPDCQGLDSIARVRAVAPHQAIVILSGHGEEALATAAVQAGAQDYLIKGHVDELMLQRALRYAVERQQLTDRLAHSEARLQDENALLRRLSSSAGELFSARGTAEICSLLPALAQRISGGSVTLHRVRRQRESTSVESDHGHPADAFIRAASNAQRAVPEPGRGRVVLPIAGSDGRTSWLVDVRADAARPFTDADVFALELLRHDASIALRNAVLLAELQEQRASVIRLNHFKDDLIAVLAHDFKGPLTTIVGYVDALDDHIFDPQQTSAAIHAIREAALRLGDLANDTLSLSRAEQGEMHLSEEPLAVAELISEVIAPLNGERRVRLTIDAPGAQVLGDRARLRQALDNVLRNAVKYSPAEAPIGVRLDGDGESVRIAVTDRGIGVPREEIAFLFDRFSRGSNAKRSTIKGSGLGLYLSNIIVQRHGGRIDVESEVGKGSTFTIVLPALAARARTRPVHLRVLAACADRDLGSFLIHELRRNGCSARLARSAEQAVTQFGIEAFDALIIDRETIEYGLLEHALTGANMPALIAVGGEPGEDAQNWDAQLPRLFMSADLAAALGRAARYRATTAVPGK